MPIYEHRCNTCGEIEERLLPLNHDEQIHCGAVMSNMISRTSPPIFKGSGFYATEYGSQMGNLTPEAHKRRLDKEMKDRGWSRSNPGQQRGLKEISWQDKHKYVAHKL